MLQENPNRATLGKPRLKHASFVAKLSFDGFRLLERNQPSPAWGVGRDQDFPLRTESASTDETGSFNRLPILRQCQQEAFLCQGELGGQHWSDQRGRQKGTEPNDRTGIPGTRGL